METFKINTLNTISNKTEIIEIVHTDDLKNRKGYDKNYLGKTIPLPKLNAAEENNRVTVLTDVGANGDQVLDYTHFSVVFNKVKRLPYYTAVNMDGPTAMMGLPHEQRKSDRWFNDYRIETEDDSFQLGRDEYANSGFDKGHMVRYFDPAWGSSDLIKKKAMGDTFHYTNCCPQIHHFNGVVWNYLEDYYMARSIFKDRRMTIFTGPIFNKAKKIGSLLVPVNFWKVVAYKNGKGGISALGFIMSQEIYLDKLETQKALVTEKLVQPKLKEEDIDRLYQKQEIIDAIVKVSFIEQKTGLKFGLNQADENKSKSEGFYQLLYKTTKVQSRVMTFEQFSAQKDLTTFFQAM